jgi:hypothetical protein
MNPGWQTGYLLSRRREIIKVKKEQQTLCSLIKMKFRDLVQYG